MADICSLLKSKSYLLADKSEQIRLDIFWELKLL